MSMKQPFFVKKIFFLFLLQSSLFVLGLNHQHLFNIDKASQYIGSGVNLNKVRQDAYRGRTPPGLSKLVAQRLATVQNDQVEEETLEQLAKTNLLKTFELTAERLRKMILRHEKELSHKGSIIVVPLDTKPALETLIDRKGVEDALSGDILSPCAEKVNEDSGGKSQDSLSYAKFEEITKSMTPEERAAFDEKQISILELERSNIKSHLTNLLALSKTAKNQNDANSSDQKKSFKHSDKKKTHDTSGVDKVSQSKEGEEEEEDEEENDEDT